MFNWAGDVISVGIFNTETWLRKLGRKRDYKIFVIMPKYDNSAQQYTVAIDYRCFKSKGRAFVKQNVSQHFKLVTFVSLC
jgi:hypothetical protein